MGCSDESCFDWHQRHAAHVLSALCIPCGVVYGALAATVVGMVLALALV